MSELVIRPFGEGDLAAVRALWEACGLTVPWNDPARDIAFCQASADAEVFVGKEEDRLVATVMTGHDGHRGWLYYVAVDPALQGRGLGRRMVDHAESWLCRLGVPKVNLMIREDNEAVARFYDALGYAREPRVVMSRFLKNDTEKGS